MRSGRFALLALVVLLVPCAAFATHIPGSSVVISYDGPLAPGTPATGTIGWNEPADGYDWYCFDVTSGTKVTISVSRTTGDILPNLGVMRGLAGTGGTASLPIIKDTSNSTDTSTTLEFTPDFSGPVTLWVSTFLGEKKGDYSVTMTGGSGRSACGAVTAGPSGPQISVTVAEAEYFVGNAASITIPLTVATVGGFAYDVALNITGLPEDVETKLSKDVIPKPGAGTTDLTIKTAAMTLPATYPVFITATGFDRTASYSFLLTVFCDPPLILSSDQPKSTSVTGGNVATLEVKPTGTGPFFYQWYTGHSGHTNFPVAGATSKKLTTSAINNTSEYWVRVWNACGSADSQTATITVTGLTSARTRRSR